MGGGVNASTGRAYRVRGPPWARAATLGAPELWCASGKPAETQVGAYRGAWTYTGAPATVPPPALRALRNELLLASLVGGRALHLFRHSSDLLAGFLDRLLRLLQQ